MQNIESYCFALLFCLRIIEGSYIVIYVDETLEYLHRQCQLYELWSSSASKEHQFWLVQPSLILIFTWRIFRCLLCDLIRITTTMKHVPLPIHNFFLAVCSIRSVISTVHFSVDYPTVQIPLQFMTSFVVPLSLSLPSLPNPKTLPLERCTSYKNTSQLTIPLWYCNK